jgi:hypothetical protein
MQKPQEKICQRARKSFAAHPSNHPYAAKHMLLAPLNQILGNYIKKIFRVFVILNYILYL